MVQWAIDCMDELRKEVWREAKQEKKNQPKRTRGRPRKGEEGKETTKYGKSHKYALGKNPENLTEHQRSCIDEIKELYPKMFRGYQLKEGLRKVFQCSKDTIEKELKAWLSWACRSKLKPFVELSKKIRRDHCDRKTWIIECTNRIHQQQDQSVDTKVIWIQEYTESYRYDHDRMFQVIL